MTAGIARDRASLLASEKQDLPFGQPLGRWKAA